jgi:hypothetical protein
MVLFQFGGIPLARWDLRKAATLYGGSSPHGFRSGAATSLLLIGMPVKDIMLLGRWMSFAVTTYLKAAAAQSRNDRKHDFSGANYAIAMQQAPAFASSRHKKKG